MESLFPGDCRGGGGLVYVLVYVLPQTQGLIGLLAQGVGCWTLGILAASALPPTHRDTTGRVNYHSYYHISTVMEHTQKVYRVISIQAYTHTLN